MRFPLDKTARGVTRDFGSFKSLDLSKETEIPAGADHRGSFGAVRKNHIHEGVDLYARDGDGVFAMEEGVLVARVPFTGAWAQSAWWEETEALCVEGASGVICYGEVIGEEPLREGRKIAQGERLGSIKRVLKKDKGRPMSMLHLELYEPGTREFCQSWELGAPQPKGLLDPTDLLARSAGLEEK